MIKKAVKKETIKKESVVKRAAVKPAVIKKEEKAISTGRYIETVGRRKTSIARVRLMIGGSGI